MRRLTPLALLALLATREGGVRTDLPLAGPWGRGVEISQIHWLDNARVMFVEDEVAHVVEVGKGVVDSFPLGDRNLVGASGANWLVAEAGEEANTSDLFLGPPGEEQKVATLRGPLSRWELAWTSQGPWLRGWLGRDGAGPPLVPGRAWSRGGALWVFDPAPPGALWRLSPGEGPVQVAAGDAAGGIRLAAAAPAANGETLLAQTKAGKTRLLLLGAQGSLLWSREWTDKTTYGLYAEETVAWRISPRLPGTFVQEFCSPECEEIPPGTWMQSRAWSLGDGRWIVGLRDLSTGEVALAIAPGMRIFARLDRMSALAVSPDRRRIALVRAVESRRWDWDLVVIDAPAP
ncbi:hypothetical protein IIA16_06805 [bacterium]|nr:hypothetical protein [bacterium]